jgi:serine/threonine-protein kinase
VTEPDRLEEASVGQALARQFTPPQPGEAVITEGRYYWLGRFISQGYFGAVYECTDEWANPLVAKVLLPRNRSYEQVRGEWLRELQNLVMLRHPNITFVHDAFEYRDTFYIVLERCDQTLGDLINWAELDPNVWVYPIAQCILQAVHFIHRANYVHKDIHPGNIHISRSHGFMASPSPATVFKLGDLGITRLETEINVFNTMLAKWMLPPEAISPADFGVVDKRVDVYHVGLSLLSLLLKGIPSFSQEEIVAGRPRELAEGLSHPLASPLGRALRRHVASRTSSALELWREIQTVQTAGRTLRPAL